MGKSNSSSASSPSATNTQAIQSAQNQYNQLQSGPTPLENQLGQQAQSMWTNYGNAVTQDTKDRGNIMSGYSNWQSGQLQPLINSINGRAPHNFTMQTVAAPHSANSDYAMAGYKNFADTGGYSNQDITDLRSRGMSPIRAAYGNTMMQLDRARALGGNGGAANYIAARSKAQRELPGQLADAESGVNAQLAQDIRSGKLQGLAGVTGISEDDLNRQIQASLANQSTDMQKQSLTEQAYNSHVANQLSAQGLYGNSLAGMTSLYGTTPGMSSMFGNQALGASGNQLTAQGQRNALSTNLLGMQIQGAQGLQNDQGTPWWQKLLGIAGQGAQTAKQIQNLTAGSGPYGGGGNLASQYATQPEQNPALWNNPIYGNSNMNSFGTPVNNNPDMNSSSWAPPPIQNYSPYYGSPTDYTPTEGNW